MKRTSELRPARQGVTCQRKVRAVFQADGIATADAWGEGKFSVVTEQKGTSATGACEPPKWSRNRNTGGLEATDRLSARVTQFNKHCLWSFWELYEEKGVWVDATGTSKKAMLGVQKKAVLHNEDVTGMIMGYILEAEPKECTDRGWWWRKGGKSSMPEYVTWSSGWMLGPFTAIYKMEGGAGFRGKGTERGIGNLYSSALDEEAKRSQVSLRVWGSGLE